MRRISEGNSSSNSTSRYTLPPLSTHSHTPTLLPSLQEQESNGDKSSIYHSKEQYSTFSYSYPPQQHEEYYYPVYNKHAWSEGKNMKLLNSIHCLQIFLR